MNEGTEVSQEINYEPMREKASRVMNKQPNEWMKE